MTNVLIGRYERVGHHREQRRQRERDVHAATAPAA